MSVRSIVERLAAPLVFQRRMPAKLGGGRVFVCTQNGGLKFLVRRLERIDPFLFALAEEFVRPGMRVWDIGANLGLFTFAAANRAGPDGAVVAVDADIDNVRLLLKTRSGLDPARNAAVHVIPAAIAGVESSSFATLQIARRCRASNALDGFGQSQTGGFVERRTVPAYTLDQLLDSFPAPEFVKMDIEGAELMALRGATRLLRDVRPVFCIEVAGEQQENVSALLRDHDYRFFDAEADRAERIELALMPWNGLAVPAERGYLATTAAETTSAMR